MTKPKSQQAQSPISKFPKMDACEIKAKTQPHFTILAQDNFAPVLLGQWIRMAEFKGTPSAKVNEARRLLAHIEEWRRQNPMNCKTPD